ncbi:MAG: hypothetical protein IJW05_12460 [Lentisphaeria bacterium]|nr:hypothetical protein [Lentisphaeria bacterium]
MNRIVIRTNTVTNRNFDEFGNFFSLGNPRISVNSTFQVEWYLYTATPDANEESLDVSSWTTDASFSGYSAVLTCDSDWVHRVSGTLVSGSISAGGTFPEQLTVNIANAKSQNISPSGKFSIYNSNGMFQTVIYTGMEILSDGKSVLLTLGSGVKADYAFNDGDSVTVSQEVYFESVNSAELSDPANGKFVFNVTARSRKLQAVVDTAGSGSIAIQGIELLPFLIDEENNYTQAPAYLLDSAVLVSTIGDPIGDADVSDPLKSEIGAIVDEKLKDYSGGGGGGSGNGTASNTTITDSGNYYESTTVEGALQEIGTKLNGVEAALAEI